MSKFLLENIITDTVFENKISVGKGIVVFGNEANGISRKLDIILNSKLNN